MSSEYNIDYYIKKENIRAGITVIDYDNSGMFTTDTEQKNFIKYSMKEIELFVELFFNAYGILQFIYLSGSSKNLFKNEIYEMCKIYKIEKMEHILNSYILKKEAIQKTDLSGKSQIAKEDIICDAFIRGGSFLYDDKKDYWFCYGDYKTLDNSKKYAINNNNFKLNSYLRYHFNIYKGNKEYKQIIDLLRNECQRVGKEMKKKIKSIRQYSMG